MEKSYFLLIILFSSHGVCGMDASQQKISSLLLINQLAQTGDVCPPKKEDKQPIDHVVLIPENFSSEKKLQSLQLNDSWARFMSRLICNAPELLVLFCVENNWIESLDFKPSGTLFGYVLPRDKQD
jgi:hypothetical protein